MFIRWLIGRWKSSKNVCNGINDGFGVKEEIVEDILDIDNRIVLFNKVFSDYGDVLYLCY